MAQLKNSSKQITICSELIIAKSFWDRTKGLIGRPSLREETGMWILQCNWIHSFFMSFSFDAIFVDHQLIVKDIKPNISPGRFTSPAWGAHSVFEVANGVAAKCHVELGDQLNVGD